jgi:hypothetical protein
MLFIPQYVSQRARQAQQFGVGLCAAAALLIGYRIFDQLMLFGLDGLVNDYSDHGLLAQAIPLCYYSLLLMAGIAFIYRARVTYFLLSFATASVLMLAGFSLTPVVLTDFTAPELAILAVCLTAALHRILTRGGKGSRRLNHIVSGAAFGVLATVTLNVLV